MLFVSCHSNHPYAKEVWQECVALVSKLQVYCCFIQDILDWADDMVLLPSCMGNCWPALFTVWVLGFFDSYNAVKVYLKTWFLKVDAVLDDLFGRGMVWKRGIKERWLINWHKCAGLDSNYNHTVFFYWGGGAPTKAFQTKAFQKLSSMTWFTGSSGICSFLGDPRYQGEKSDILVSQNNDNFDLWSLSITLW